MLPQHEKGHARTLNKKIHFTVIYFLATVIYFLATHPCVLTLWYLSGLVQLRETPGLFHKNVKSILKLCVVPGQYLLWL